MESKKSYEKLEATVDKFSETVQDEKIADEGPIQQNLFDDVKKLVSQFIKVLFRRYKTELENHCRQRSY